MRHLIIKFNRILPCCLLIWLSNSSFKARCANCYRRFERSGYFFDAIASERLTAREMLQQMLFQKIFHAAVELDPVVRFAKNMAFIRFIQPFYGLIGAFQRTS